MELKLSRRRLLQLLTGAAAAPLLPVLLSRSDDPSRALWTPTRKIFLPPREGWVSSRLRQIELENLAINALAETKTLYGAYQFPIAVALGQMRLALAGQMPFAVAETLWQQGELVTVTSHEGYADHVLQGRIFRIRTIHRSLPRGIRDRHSEVILEEVT
jgi:hypothetical protein